MCIFCFKQKKSHKQKAKETKENRKTKETKEEKRKKMLLLTVSVENLMGYDDIVCEFALCTFNLRDQQRKRERAKKR